MGSFVELMKKLKERDEAHLSARFPYANLLDSARNRAGEEKAESSSERAETEDELVRGIVADLVPDEAAPSEATVEGGGEEVALLEESAAETAAGEVEDVPVEELMEALAEVQTSADVEVEPAQEPAAEAADPVEEAMEALAEVETPADMEAESVQEPVGEAASPPEEAAEVAAAGQAPEEESEEALVARAMKALDEAETSGEGGTEAAAESKEEPVAAEEPLVEDEEAPQELEAQAAAAIEEEIAQQVQAAAARLSDSEEAEETGGEARTGVAAGTRESDDVDVEAILAQVTGKAQREGVPKQDEGRQAGERAGGEKAGAVTESEAADVSTAQGGEGELSEQDETALRTLFGSAEASGAGEDQGGESGEASSEEAEEEAEVDEPAPEEVAAYAEANATPDVSEAGLFQQMTSGGGVSGGSGSVAVARRGPGIGAESIMKWATKLLQPDLSPALLWAFGIVGAITIAALIGALLLEIFRG